jgi:hypothetical protein
MFTKKRIIATLALLALTSGLLTNCTQESKIKDADRRQRDAKTQLAKAETLQKNYKAKLADATTQAIENKKISADLNAQVTAWTSKQTEREQALFKMQEMVTAEELSLKGLRDQKVVVDEYIKTERARIKSESDNLEASKKSAQAELTKVNAEIAKLKADNESDIKAKSSAADADIKSKVAAADKEITTKKANADSEISAKEKALVARQAELAAQIAKADARDLELKDKSALLDDQEVIQNQSQEQLDKLQVSLNERKAQLESSIASTKEFFMKNALGDVFEKINANEKLIFLVRVVGFGSAQNLKYVRDQVQSLTDVKSKYKNLARLGDLGKNSTAVLTAGDTFLIDVEANKLKAVRDSIEATLSGKNSKDGESRNYNSLWLVIRPVNKVRAGMKMVVNGSTSKYFDGRTNEEVAVFANIHSNSQQVMGISDLDLTKPGAYMFENSKAAKSCESVTIDCLESLVKENLLEAKQSMDLTDASGTVTQVESYRKLLEFMMAGSINQSRNDLKEKTVLGIKLDKFDNQEWTFDKDALMDKYGFADRAPVIDDISLQYTVSMIESISPVTNDMDTYLFLYSGLVGKNQMYDLTERKRGEIAIPLPIAQYKESHAALKDLSLKDFKTKAQIPVKPAELTKIESIGYWARTDEQQAQFDKLYYTYKSDLSKAEEDIELEKQTEFEKRTFYNAGILSLMVEKLQK